MLTLPDAEVVVVDFLRTVGPVTDIVGTRVYTEIPANPTFPLLRIQAIPGGDVRYLNGLWLSRLQVDCWGDGKWQASRLIRRAHAALVEVRNWRHENSDGEACWLHGTRNVVAPGPSSDQDTDKTRYLFDVHALLRPTAPAAA